MFPIIAAVVFKDLHCRYGARDDWLTVVLWLTHRGMRLLVVIVNTLNANWSFDGLKRYYVNRFILNCMPFPLGGALHIGFSSEAIFTMRQSHADESNIHFDDDDDAADDFRAARPKDAFVSHYKAANSQSKKSIVAGSEQSRIW